MGRDFGRADVEVRIVEAPNQYLGILNANWVEDQLGARKAPRILAPPREISVSCRGCRAEFNFDIRDLVEVQVTQLESGKRVARSYRAFICPICAYRNPFAVSEYADAYTSAEVMQPQPTPATPTTNSEEER